MKKLILLILSAAMILLFSYRAEAAEIPSFDDSIEEIKSNVNDDARQRMTQLGITEADVMSASEISFTDTLKMIGDIVAEAAKGPFSACVILITVIILASLLESYTFSLRYVDTRDVMNVVTSLMVITSLVTPVADLIQTALDTAKGAASLMLVYAPVMMGIMAFSGHLVQSGGYYAAVMAASQGIAQLSGVFFAPLMNIYLALAVSSAVSERIRLNGICELLSKLFKWTLTFAMMIFTAILSIQGFAGSAADSVASKAVRFTLSSFIPVVGASVSEAYKTIRGSIDLLRSGIGVFVIIAVIITFLPMIIQIILWRVSVLAAKTVAETFGVDSTVRILNSVSDVLSVLSALIVTVMSVFLVSSGVLIAVGGSS